MNIFIIPSCIRTGHGAVIVEERFNQTIKTFDTIRQKVSDAFIVFVDNSKIPFTAEELELIKPKINSFLPLHDNENAQKINDIPNVHIAKGMGEGYMLYCAMESLKQYIDFSKVTGRMFKVGGRCVLEDEFDITRYDNLYGKYTFKTRKPSWRNDCESLLDTRMYSWCFTLIDEYQDIIANKNPNYILKNIDTEHAHYINIPKDKLVEFDKIHVGCIVALTGNYVSD
jgi:hypothetical protein